MMQRIAPYAETGVAPAPRPSRRLTSRIGAAARPTVAAGLLACGLLALLSTGSVQAGPQAVVELFTSQGCSACPPADDLVGEMADRDDLVVLSLPVDYWDYLGWKDTLARSDHSARQRAYAERRGDRAVYTPQAVVNGRRHVVGSDKRALRIAIDSGGGLPVGVRARLTNDALAVDIEGGKPSKSATVWLVLFDRARPVKIKFGENRGRTVVYHNVVRRMQAIGMWKGEPLTLELPRSEIAKAGSLGCAILVQAEGADGQLGPIYGAAYLDTDLTTVAP